MLESPSGDEALSSISVWDSEEDTAEYSSALMEYFLGVTGAEGSVEQEPMFGEEAHRIVTDAVAVDVRSKESTVWLAVAKDLDTLDAIVAATVEDMVER